MIHVYPIEVDHRSVYLSQEVLHCFGVAINTVVRTDPGGRHVKCIDRKDVGSSEL